MTLLELDVHQALELFNTILSDIANISSSLVLLNTYSYTSDQAKSDQVYAFCIVLITLIFSASVESLFIIHVADNTIHDIAHVCVAAFHASGTLSYHSTTIELNIVELKSSQSVYSSAVIRLGVTTI
ncbi:hypothetical protein HOF65_05665 [bacterium]|nr:hypothetical protein [bacterium]MBT4633602.1 hypothetical protein [bacterium]MBT5492453.1 hypothetical protein [bacterium]MBT6778738.1 hypothetical protein [bacterium]